jgi:uncharacterized protein YecE (DUF72 family)
VGVELRNRDWVSDENYEKTLKYFRAHKLTMVSVDGPEAAHFTIMPGTDAVTNRKLAYIRLHGRNAKGYIRGRTVAERFNYQYSEEELQEVAERVSSLAEATKEVHVVYNNNASDYAPKAAARFQEIIEEEHDFESGQKRSRRQLAHAT